MPPATLIRRHARGFTLVELMVTVSIALFLVGGLLTIVQNMRTTYINQQALVQLQDEQRFALTVITDAVQAAGYFPDPVAWDVTSAFPGTGNFPTAGQIFFGTHAPGVADTVAQDTIWMRFMAQNAPTAHGPILCNGIDSSTQPLQTWDIEFSLNAQQQLVCTVTGTVNGTSTVPLVSGVAAFAVYYGVDRTSPGGYNIDTYETYDIATAAGDTSTIGAVRVVLTFVNPLAGQSSQPPTITLERVIDVMSHGGH